MTTAIAILAVLCAIAIVLLYACLFISSRESRAEERTGSYTIHTYVKPGGWPCKCKCGRWIEAGEALIIHVDAEGIVERHCGECELRYAEGAAHEVNICHLN